MTTQLDPRLVTLRDEIEAKSRLLAECQSADRHLADAQRAHDACACDLVRAAGALTEARLRREAAYAALEAPNGRPPASAKARSDNLPSREARAAGYEGDPCPSCGERKLVRSGTRYACDGCGTRREGALTADVSPPPPVVERHGRTAEVTPAPAPPGGALAIDPLPPLVLPCHRQGGLYVFLDPADATIANDAGLLQAFAAERFGEMAAKLRQATGRQLVAHEAPEPGAKRQRKPRAKKAEAPPPPEPEPQRESRQAQWEAAFAGWIRAHPARHHKEPRVRDDAKDAINAGLVEALRGDVAGVLGRLRERLDGLAAPAAEARAAAPGFLPGFAPPTPTAAAEGL